MNISSNKLGATAEMILTAAAVEIALMGLRVGITCYKHQRMPICPSQIGNSLSFSPSLCACVCARTHVRARVCVTCKHVT